ncbi:tRNA lysidine(34) synthetase [Aspergillus homomorphus CBS 101889]|uniref:tRNA(Ile)-lysidine synthetase n=1 Tax=Aspergillus homomorphus (strain CBS 101889) TaxID=1450537 RepID=A0A395I2U5_ASPHC|nr:hypothetical protein BO97DRAFT_441902 [Aspergillus homomorphus CBS 101889]RAL13993.1 hypothetical protein BO97DRAFT_441902 [Aspergillus homomorphus CBS 101889]
MAISRLLRQGKPSAITVSQFIESFQRIWHDSRPRAGWTSREARLPSRLGLAISGGADSMALAYLCREWEKFSVHGSGSSRTTLASTSEESPPAPSPVEVTAFIVDHKAREESSREAAMVAGWLGEMGIQTQILPLDWSNLNPNEISAFETHARRLRFQALGQACRTHHIDALLTGHHRDDNVETTLWRLCTGARGAGLGGIPAVTGIPECHGLFGVVGSREVAWVRSSSQHQQRQRQQQQQQQQQQNQTQNQNQQSQNQHPPPEKEATLKIQIATGTLPIIRPLLNFPKSDLLATCAKHHIPFVSDPTNFDPTLTPRNAIRDLLRREALPRALREESVLGLIEKSKRLIRSAWADSDRCLEGCRVLGFVPETGVVVVRFPAGPAAAAATSAGASEPQIQALTLRRITELVSPFPENHFPLRGFEKFTSRVFPASPLTESESQSQSQTPTQERQPFTLGGVMFQPISQRKGADTTTTPPKEKQEEEKEGNTWLLSRQPYMKNRLPTLDIELPPPAYPLPNSTSTSTSTSTQGTESPEEWHLWDNRFWFRFSITPKTNPPENPTGPEPGLRPGRIRIRPLQKSDLKFLRQRQRSPQHKSPPARVGKSPREDQKHNKNENGTQSNPEIISLLSKLSPGSTRFTIPVLVLRRAEDSTRGSASASNLGRNKGQQQQQQQQKKKKSLSRSQR